MSRRFSNKIVGIRWDFRPHVRASAGKSPRRGSGSPARRPRPTARLPRARRQSIPGTVNPNGASVGIHDPDEGNTGLEVGFDLLVNLVHQVIRRDDLDRKIGRNARVAIRKLLVREAPRANEGDVGFSDGPRRTREALETGIGREDPAKFLVLDEFIKTAIKATSYPTGKDTHVPLHEFAVDQLVTLLVRHREQVFRCAAPSCPPRRPSVGSPRGWGRRIPASC